MQNPRSLIYFKLCLLLLDLSKAGGDRCFRSDDIETRPWYPSITSNESGGSDRTHLFPYACSPAEIIGTQEKPLVKIITSTDKFNHAYNTVTREHNELFVYYDYTHRPSVAKIDADTMETLWRTILFENLDGEWGYFGTMGVHGNGYLYVVSGYFVVKIDAESGDIIQMEELPTMVDLNEGHKKGDTVYNGFVLFEDGTLVMKSMTRKAGCILQDVTGVLCVDKDKPMILIGIDADSLAVKFRIDQEEISLGRVSVSMLDDVEYAYLPGEDSVYRYKYKSSDTSLIADTSWGPVRYRENRLQNGGTAVAVFNDYIVITTNMSPSVFPMSITVISQHNSTEKYAMYPFEQDFQQTNRLLRRNLVVENSEFVEGGKFSFCPSKPTVDPVHNRIFAYDFLAGKLASLNFVPGQGLNTSWEKDIRTTYFGAAVGGSDNRVFVIPYNDLDELKDYTMWMDAETGEELLRSGPLDMGAFTPITPGFGGDINVLSRTGKISKLSIIEA